jgi:hypothetical protein
MIKFLNEMVPDRQEPPKYFNMKDVLIGDEEKIWIDRKELLNFQSEFCDVWDSKGSMKAMIEAEMAGGPGMVLLRWEDNSKDWIPNQCLKYFDKVGSVKV